MGRSRFRDEEKRSSEPVISNIISCSLLSDYYHVIAPFTTSQCHPTSMLPRLRQLQARQGLLPAYVFCQRTSSRLHARQALSIHSARQRDVVSEIRLRFCHIAHKAVARPVTPNTIVRICSRPNLALCAGAIGCSAEGGELGTSIIVEASQVLALRSMVGLPGHVEWNSPIGDGTSISWLNLMKFWNRQSFLEVSLNNHLTIVVASKAPSRRHARVFTRDLIGRR